MAIHPRLSVWLLAASLSGCALAPGPHLDADRMQDDLGTPTGTTKYQVTLITPSLIAEQAKAEAAKYAAEPPSAPHRVGQGSGDYRVGAKDIIGITVWGHPELSAGGGAAAVQAQPNVAGAALNNGIVGTPPESGGSDAGTVSQRVAADGTIFFPTLGRVEVAGKTPAQISRVLASRLSARFKDPQVDVSVLQYRSQQIQITGDIKNPGTMPITDTSLHLVDAIARAGGSLPDADLQRVRLTRDGKVFVYDVNAALARGDESQNVMLRNGDIVNVPDHNDSRVFVIGEVPKPAVMFMNKGRLTLADAVANAGSIDPKAANPRQVLVIRHAKGNETQPEIYRLDMTQVDALLLSTQFALKPLDVVYVGTAPAVRFNRLLDQVLPSVESLYLLSTVGH